MRRSLLAFLLLLLALPARAGYEDYDRVPFGAESRDEVTVTNLPPVRDQDTTGLCYAFQQSLLLEAHDCRVQGIDCQQNDRVIVSPLFVGSLKRGNVRELTDGGDPLSGLQQIHSSYNNNVVGESCAPFDQLTQTGKEPMTRRLITDQGVGWRKLAAIYESYRKLKSDPQSCAQKALAILTPKVQISLQQVLDALDQPSEDAFRASLLVPSSCMNPQNMVHVPDYEIHIYPEWGKPAKKDEMLRRIKGALSAGIPLGVNLCLRTKIEQGKTICAAAHSTVITGMKTFCANGDCNLALKLQNSWGEGFQEYFEGGWVQADRLIDQAVLDSQTGNDGDAIHWLTKPGEKVPLPPAVENVDSTPPPEKTPTGLYKCLDDQGHTLYTDNAKLCKGHHGQ